MTLMLAICRRAGWQFSCRIIGGFRLFVVQFKQGESAGLGRMPVHFFKKNLMMDEC